MDLGLRGKAAVVTGGSRGIGRAIALRLAEEGASVAICARGEQALRETEAELRTRRVPVFAAVCDVSHPEALDGFLDAARKRDASLSGECGRMGDARDSLANVPLKLTIAWELQALRVTTTASTTGCDCVSALAT
jgi:NAD(P)-dependent dehydrogenase (short-subunit alcohol dehydrogenase family)